MTASKNSRTKSTAAKLFEMVLLVPIVLISLPTLGYGIASMFTSGAEVLNMQLWMWKVFCVCTVLCVSIGLYSQVWKHCIFLPISILGVLNIGAVFGRSGLVHGDEQIQQVANLLGLCTGVLMPVLCTLFGTIFAFEKWIRTR